MRSLSVVVVIGALVGCKTDAPQPPPDPCTELQKARERCDASDYTADQQAQAIEACRLAPAGPVQKAVLDCRTKASCTELLTCLTQAAPPAPVPEPTVDAPAPRPTVVTPQPVPQPTPDPDRQAIDTIRKHLTEPDKNMAWELCLQYEKPARQRKTLWTQCEDAGLELIDGMKKSVKKIADNQTTDHWQKPCKTLERWTRAISLAEVAAAEALCKRARRTRWDQLEAALQAISDQELQADSAPICKELMAELETLDPERYAKAQSVCLDLSRQAAANPVGVAEVTIARPCTANGERPGLDSKVIGPAGGALRTQDGTTWVVSQGDLKAPQTLRLVPTDHVVSDADLAGLLPVGMAFRLDGASKTVARQVIRTPLCRLPAGAHANGAVLVEVNASPDDPKVRLFRRHKPSVVDGGVAVFNLVRPGSTATYQPMVTTSVTPEKK